MTRVPLLGCYGAVGAVLALVATLLGGCAVLAVGAARSHATTPTPSVSCSASPGLASLCSPTCPCRLSYPASWSFQDARGDASKPAFGLYSYDDVSADHATIPARYASIGVDWQPDPAGQLYLATTTRNFGGVSGRPLTVSGYPAMSYAYWTDRPADGGVYQQHVYVYVPANQRDYDLSFTASPPSANVVSAQRIFARTLRSLVIVRPGMAP